MGGDGTMLLVPGTTVTADACLGKRERDWGREREGGKQILAVADVIIIAMVNVG